MSRKVFSAGIASVQRTLYARQGCENQRNRSARTTKGRAIVLPRNDGPKYSKTGRIRIARINKGMARRKDLHKAYFCRNECGRVSQRAGIVTLLEYIYLIDEKLQLKNHCYK